MGIIGQEGLGACFGFLNVDQESILLVTPILSCLFGSSGAIFSICESILLIIIYIYIKY